LGIAEPPGFDTYLGFWYNNLMAKYEGIQKEHQLKNLVFDDYFDTKKFSWEQEVDNIDFIITNPKTRSDLFGGGTQAASLHYLWAEVKLHTQDVYEMLTQLILTCKKTYDKAEYLAPPYISCFDTAHIAFVDFHLILPVFSETDINWTQAPSNHDTADFEKACKKIKALIGADLVIYNFGSDDGEIKEFIRGHIGVEGARGIKSPINKDNFVQIFVKWVKQVKPTINISKEKWADLKKHGVLDADFFRADMMSSGGNTINDKLKIFLENDKYKYQQVFEGDLFSRIIDFTDGGEAYNRFWSRWERPPVAEYQKYIVDRRDLLVPQNIREMKGSYFTPSIWVKKSQEYLAKVFGENWQEEYYVWDCACGTGNLLAGLTNKYNVWSSDIDQTNVDTINALIDIDDNLDLLPAHVFQFDFLNDSFDKLPEKLREIIGDSGKRKKLIVYINPPYAETMSKGVRHKAGLNKTYINDKYKASMGNAANRELFIQFLTRIYYEIPDCIIANFSTLKILNAPHFTDYRNHFLAKLIKLFVCPAGTFDNVNGKFLIGFHIWNTGVKKHFTSITADVFDMYGNKAGKKRIFCYDDAKYINEWVISTRKRQDEKIIGFMSHLGNDFQQNNVVFIINDKKQMAAPRGSWITDKNIIEISINYAVRHCIEATWLNNRDQFLWPNDGWEKDFEFQNDCLIFTLFHGQNRISSNDGTNHWIPFTEEQVGAKEKFSSDFMGRFLKGKTLSPEARALYNAGLELWKYYHKETRNNNTVSVDASFYDIRGYFQGRNEKGSMQNKSADETYNTLIKDLRDKLKALSAKIEPKVYEYGFLRL